MEKGNRTTCGVVHVHPGEFHQFNTYGDNLRNELVFLIVIFTVFLFGLIVGIYFDDPIVNFDNEINTQEESAIPSLSEYEIFSQSQTKLLAVDQEGNGVITNLTVRAVPGEGRVLVDVESLLFWIDTQQSIQTSRKVAEDYLGEIEKNLDLTYTIDIPNASIVGGPSAGASFAIATIAALKNESLREDTVITGTIEEDGSIGAVGGVLEKGMAAKEAGYTNILVPEGQSKYKEYGKEEECEKYGSLRICNIEYKPIEIDVEKEIEIDVTEVSNINEAVEYFLM